MQPDLLGAATWEGRSLFLSTSDTYSNPLRSSEPVSKLL